MRAPTNRLLKKSPVDVRQGGKRRKSAVYKQVHEHFEPLSNAAWRRTRVFQQPVKLTPPKTARNQGQAGVTLIEVLIAVVILAIGILGMISLQTQAVATNHDAYLRSQAVNLSYDMIERMRVNRQAALNLAYNHTMGNPAPGGVTLAQVDLNQWLNALATTLPQGQGGVTVAGRQASVEVRWDGSRGANPLNTIRVATDL